jgi:hypothetical protein
MPEPTPTSTPFRGFHSPNYTIVPDELFDELLATLSGAELKVLLYIIRRTFGFKRDADAISLSQMLSGITTKDGRVLDRGIGLSKPTLLGALRSLIAQNIIETQRRRSVARGDEPTVYKLKFVTPAPENDDLPPRGKKTLPPPLVKKVNHPVVKKSTTQDTVIQNTDISLSNIRKEKVSRQKNEQIYAENTIVLDDPSPPHAGTPEEKHVAHRITPSQTTAPSGFTAIGAMLDTRRRALPQPGSADRDTILTRIEQFAEEFDDRASLKSSTSRACNLLARSRLTQEQFITCLWEARTITRQRIAEAHRHGEPVRAKMGYFFSVLAERLGVQDAPSKALTSSRKHGAVAV